MLDFYTVLVVSNAVRKAVKVTGVTRALFKVGKSTQATDWTETPCSARASVCILILFSPQITPFCICLVIHESFCMTVAVWERCCNSCVIHWTDYDYFSTVNKHKKEETFSNA